jgi:hypothetical protein
MRIREDAFTDHTLYTQEERERVQQTFDSACGLDEIYALIRDIRAEEPRLRTAILSDVDKEQIAAVQAGFDRRMRDMAQATDDNIENYRIADWKYFYGGKADG